MSDRSRTGWSFAVTAVALFMVALDNLVVITALPVIKRDLGASLSSLEWTVNAYTLIYAECQDSPCVTAPPTSGPMAMASPLTPP
jgi:MFS family permease